jgi:hypothetical protein
MKSNIFIEENVKEQASVVENIIKYYSQRSGNSFKMYIVNTCIKV